MSGFFSYFIPNQNQITSWVRIALNAITILLVSRGWIGEGGMSMIMALVPSISSAIWSVLAHTQAGTISAASAIPAIKKVVVSSAIADSPQFIDDYKVTAA